MTNVEIIIITVIMIILGFGLLNRIENDIDHGEEATLIRENCKGDTGFYTIDSHGRAHTIWDCTFYDVHGGEVQYE